MNEQRTVYLFRGFGPSGDAIICVGPRDFVVSVFGGGDFFQSEGLSSVFGGAAVFKNDETGVYYLGVWGARKASRFRTKLRRSAASLNIVKAPVPARLICFTSN